MNRYLTLTEVIAGSKLQETMIDIEKISVIRPNNSVKSSIREAYPELTEHAVFSDLYLTDGTKLTVVGNSAILSRKLSPRKNLIFG